ncbi:hypothetical protein [Maridesulfovibrio hydrothermalis]|uniref:Uncharacterized protein n=1 Tax=Maridesulfovibrio hydrothermalis AM13 = DSM 14728 TaxID=1121451 RepID=L0RDK8_9BACT|nr:hypothetical protein [Maridesulfovibrio hydrothermalis]CCO24307.1 conserved protein of unknown function [Maridesulfovibrio hydrothermalis AM13 = DSM 14728]
MEIDNTAPATPIESVVRDTYITPLLPTEREDHVAASLDDPALRAHEENQQQVVDEAIHSLTGRGNIIDRIV